MTSPFARLPQKFHKRSGLLAPILAEVLYDGGGPAAPLLVFGPLMIVTALAAGEWKRRGSRSLPLAFALCRLLSCPSLPCLALPCLALSNVKPCLALPCLASTRGSSAVQRGEGGSGLGLPRPPPPAPRVSLSLPLSLASLAHAVASRCVSILRASWPGGSRQICEFKRRITPPPLATSIIFISHQQRREY